VVSAFDVTVVAASGDVAADGTHQADVRLAFTKWSGKPVTFSCSDLPPHAVCAFSAPSVVPVGGIAGTTVTIRIDQPQIAMLEGGGPGGRGGRGPGSFAAVAALGLSRGLGSKRSSSRLLGLGALGLLMAEVLAACGGGGGGGAAAEVTPAASTKTPPGTYSVTVSATDGEVTQTARYSITVH
jgi:hypothetical protein